MAGQEFLVFGDAHHGPQRVHSMTGELDPSETLSGLAAVAAALQDARLSREVAELTERAMAGRFYVACIGQFKRGKSTLVNALIGAPLLPTGVVPITTVPTVVRFGPTTAARVCLGDGRWRDIAPSAIVQYVSEDKNPENAAGVTAVEVFAPAALLRDGLCLVDTPGLGSVFAANTTATTGFIPHIDAALAVIGADPPLAGDEMELIRTVAKQTTHLIIVLNKSDRVSDTERQEAVRFAEHVLTTALGRAPGPIYTVSATQALAHQPGALSDGWVALGHALRTLACQSGPTLARAAGIRGAARLIAECLRQIDQADDALRQPLERSERHVEELRRILDDATHRLLELRHLLEAEHEALTATFTARREAFVRRTMPEALGAITAAIDAMPERRGPALRRHAVKYVQALARRHIEPWLAEEQQAAEEAYRDVAARFVALANDFLARLGGSPELAAATLPEMLPPEAGFRQISRFSFHDLPVLVAATARGQWWADHLRFPAAERRAVRRDSLEYLTQLIDINGTRVQNDLDERVLESRRQLQTDVEGILRAAYESAGRAAARARRAQEAGTEAVADELARVAVLRRDVLAVQAATQSLQSQVSPDLRANRVRAGASTSRDRRVS
jgi:Dynamin family